MHFVTLASHSSLISCQVYLLYCSSLVSVSRTPSCPCPYGAIFLTFSARLNGSLKISTLKTSNVSNVLRFYGHIPDCIDLQVLIDQAVFACHCANITVRREIDSLNERLTGDGQTIEGGDPTKGALKTKGTVFPS